MRFIVDVALGNAAFTDEHTGDPDVGIELARLLRGLADQVEGVGRPDPRAVRRLVDYNGNPVGVARFEEADSA